MVREHGDGSLEAVRFGVIRTRSGRAMPERLLSIHQELGRLVAELGPDRAGVEELFFSRNVTTAITVAQARGVVLLTLQSAGIPVAEYKPNFVKQAVTGYGGADKAQMQEMVRLLLELESTPKPDDAADALAVAITDIHSYRLSAVNPG